MYSDGPGSLPWDPPNFHLLLQLHLGSEISLPKSEISHPPQSLRRVSIKSAGVCSDLAPKFWETGSVYTPETKPYIPVTEPELQACSQPSVPTVATGEARLIFATSLPAP